MIAFFLDVPVDPDAPTARRWITDELNKAEYAEGKSLVERIREWLGSLFEHAGNPGNAPIGIAIALAVAAVAIGIAFWIAGPVRRARRAEGSAVVFESDARTADQIRAAADAAARQGDWATSVIERFRAVIRALEERVVLEEEPGRTADEAAGAGGVVLPAVADDLARAAARFDAVCYGHMRPGPDDDAFLRAVDARVAAARRPTAKAAS